MAGTMKHEATTGLERSCGARAGDWIRIGPGCRGLERVEAHFAGHGFDAHRHDTYTIGYTVEGVQAFRYRGAARHCLPGQIFVLHPDELHDGGAGTGAGFRYRSAYVAPAAIAEALGEPRRPLPFLREAVSRHRRLNAAIAAALDDLESPMEELRRDQIVLALAEALAAADRSIAPRPLSTRHWRAVTRAREFIDTHVRVGVVSAELETVTGLNRYELARHFRVCLGTSPYRYLVLRRLDRARALIQGGAKLVDAALASGFADQSHLTRHFRKAYGMAPGRWARIAA
jgi:AraC-like DNA-binding protein